MLSKLKQSAGEVRESVKRIACAVPATTFMLMAGVTPPAWAARVNDSTGMLKSILDLVGDGVILIGVIFAAWGGVTVGRAVKDQQGGAGMAEGIGTIVGGAIIGAAGVLIKTANGQG